jgi:ribokinase
MDFVVRVERLPKPGETISGGDQVTVFGGKGANQAVAAARMGAEVALIGCIGEDDVGRRYLDHLRTEGVDCEGLNTSSKAPTGSAQILVEENGQNIIVVSPGANRLVTPEDLDRHRRTIAEADIVLFQLEIPRETVLHGIRLAAEEGTVAMLNPSPVLTDLPWADMGLGYLVLNEIEAAEISGIACVDRQGVERAAEAILKLGVRRVVMTRGSDATLLAAPGETTWAPAASVEPVDTVGAGDCFTGALAVALTEGMPTDEALRFANCAGALATTRHGAQDSLPRRDGVESLVRSMSENERP